MLYRHVRDLVSKYSFVEGVKLDGARFFIYYLKSGNLKYKTLPYRADKHMLIRIINRIKEDIDFKEKEKELKRKVKEDMDKKPLIGVKSKRWT